jgi:hypothetical protein
MATEETRLTDKIECFIKGTRYAHHINEATFELEAAGRIYLVDPELKQKESFNSIMQHTKNAIDKLRESINIIQQDQCVQEDKATQIINELTTYLIHLTKLSKRTKEQLKDMGLTYDLLAFNISNNPAKLYRTVHTPEEF